jgi:uncharacterized protein YcbK (DUF882 family)
MDSALHQDHPEGRTETIASARDLRAWRYREWLIAQAGDRFDFPAELSRMANHQKNNVWNDTPRVELWHKILPTLALVVKVREEFGPTTLNSGYRTPDYNAEQEGSAASSQHCQNAAIDFHCGTGTPAEWHAFLRALRDGAAFRGGLGLYRTFVHVDTRGVNADWTGS